jgi:tellurite resistance protein TerC
MDTIGNIWLYAIFFGIVIVMLLIDFLGFKQKQNQDVPIKQAAYWSIAWVSVAVMFGGGLWFYLQQTVGVGIANKKPWNTLQVIC